MIFRLLILIQILTFVRVTAIGQPCNIDAEEVYYLKHDLLNLREKPNVNSKVIKVLRIKTASLEIINEDSIVKDYILVKAKIDSINVKTGEEIHLGEFIGWVNFNLVDFSSDSYSFITGGEDENLKIDELLNKQEALKAVRSCKYNPSELSYCYCKKGIYSFENNEFAEAIEFFNKSITVSTINSTEYKLLAYFYRGKSKLNLNDFYGAKSDFEKVYGCKTKYNNRLVYDWSSKYSESLYKIIGFNQ
jgi:tetratricopeptide (TPR) repeat protein